MFAVYLSVDGDEAAIRRWVAEVLAGRAEVDFEVTYARVIKKRATRRSGDRPEALDPRIATELSMFDEGA